METAGGVFYHLEEHYFDKENIQFIAITYMKLTIWTIQNSTGFTMF